MCLANRVADDAILADRGSTAAFRAFEGMDATQDVTGAAIDGGVGEGPQQLVRCGIPVQDTDVLVDHEDRVRDGLEHHAV